MADTPRIMGIKGKEAVVYNFVNEFLKDGSVELTASDPVMKVSDYVVGNTVSYTGTITVDLKRYKDQCFGDNYVIGDIQFTGDSVSA
jgi:hypothetical protein